MPQLRNSGMKKIVSDLPAAAEVQEILFGSEEQINHSQKCTHQTQ